MATSVSTTAFRFVLARHNQLQPATSHVQTPADYPAEISSAYPGIHLSRRKSNLRPSDPVLDQNQAFFSRQF